MQTVQSVKSLVEQVLLLSSLYTYLILPLILLIMHNETTIKIPLLSLKVPARTPQLFLMVVGTPWYFPPQVDLLAPLSRMGFGSLEAGWQVQLTSEPAVHV